MSIAANVIPRKMHSNNDRIWRMRQAAVESSLYLKKDDGNAINL